jgi:NAD+ kinase
MAPQLPSPHQSVPARSSVNYSPTAISLSEECLGEQRTEPTPPQQPLSSTQTLPTPKFLYPGSFPTSAASSPLAACHSADAQQTPAPTTEVHVEEQIYCVQEIRKELPPSPPSLKSPKSFSSSRQKRITAEDVPRQTLLKALASRRPSLSLSPMSIAPGLRQSIMTASAIHSPRYVTSQNPDSHYNTGLNEYAIEASAALMSPTSSTTKVSSTGIAPLQSPCFYHQRFDNAVNVERVLEEIAGDEYRSHSRLMQTALGVREVARQLQRRTCKVAVKSVMIVTKARDNELVTLTRELAEWLMKTPRYGRRLGVNVYVDKKLRSSKRFDAEGLVAQEPEFENMLRYWTPDLCWSSPEVFDLVLTLGGDGTVLFTSWLFQRVVPPVLSFSLGSLGFLTNFKYDLYRETLDKVLNDGMRVNMRMRFTCTVYRDEDGESVEKDQFEVLNGTSFRSLHPCLI